jgi:hypothetical protein
VVQALYSLVHEPDAEACDTAHAHAVAVAVAAAAAAAAATTTTFPKWHVTLPQMRGFP